MTRRDAITQTALTYVHRARGRLLMSRVDAGADDSGNGNRRRYPTRQEQDMDDTRGQFPVLDRPATRTRSACLVAGCPCKDPRIVSHRRAAFFASVAREHGETANRVVAAEADWSLPVVA
jgi:hypothetical protein